MLYFRNAGMNDLKRIVEIYNQTIPSRMVTADTEPVSIESRYAWMAEHNAATRPLYVVELIDKNVIGWVSFQDFYGRPAYQATAEISIYLHEDFRGKGYGKQILGMACVEAVELQIRHLVGFIFAHNFPSLRLFKQAGFEQWGLLPNIAILDGQERSLCIVGKNL